MNKVSWLEIVERAFGECNHELHLREIYKRVYAILDSHPEIQVKTVEAIVRACIESNSKDSANFRGNNRFKSTRGKGKGYWMMLPQ